MISRARWRKLTEPINRARDFRCSLIQPNEMRLFRPLMFPTIRRGTIIRPMSTFGSYWTESVLLPQAAYVVRDDLIFTACHFDQDAHAGEFYTEHDEPTPEEIRLLASLALPIGTDRGFMAQYPDQSAFRMAEQPDLSDLGIVDQLENEVRGGLANPGSRGTTDPPLPPGGYSHRHDELPAEVQRRIYEEIDDADHLMIRGLSTWLKGSMLHCHAAFGEEANYPLYISLDASLSIVFDVLRAGGKENPTAFDAQAFIHDAFGEEQSGTRYFEEFYEDRIITMHPESRFGVFVFAPLGHDDFYWLHNGLREVYRYILLGEVIDPQAGHDDEECPRG